MPFALCTSWTAKDFGILNPERHGGPNTKSKFYPLWVAMSAFEINEIRFEEHTKPERSSESS